MKVGIKHLILGIVPPEDVFEKLNEHLEKVSLTAEQEQQLRLPEKFMLLKICLCHGHILNWKTKLEDLHEVVEA